MLLNSNIFLLSLEIVNRQVVKSYFFSLNQDEKKRNGGGVAFIGLPSECMSICSSPWKEN
jgi:hypothetical protein